MAEQSGVMTAFIGTIVVMLFYSLCITGLSHIICDAGGPTDACNYITPFTDVSNNYDLNEVGGQVENSLSRQTNIPVIELGALVFYSGNIVVDLLLNFLYAIPQMIGLLINGILLIFNVDSYIFALIEVFAATLMTVLYFIGLIQLLTGVRSGQII